MPLATVWIPDSLELPAQFLSNECLLFNLLPSSVLSAAIHNSLYSFFSLNFLRTARGLFREARARARGCHSNFSRYREREPPVRLTIPNLRVAIYKNSRSSWNVDSASTHRRIRSITYMPPLHLFFLFSPLSVSFALSRRLLFCFDEKLGQFGRKRWRVQKCIAKIVPIERQIAFAQVA